jgi:hypothetical protein
MNERIKGYIVTLDSDVYQDDAAAIRVALLMVRGVASVEPLPVDAEDFVNRERIRHELGQKLLEALKR